MQNRLFRKVLFLTIIVLFVGISVIPSTGKIDVTTSGTTIYDGSLSGYVNDTSMDPIEGVRVRVYFHGIYEEDYSDSTGYYHVTNIPICWCVKNCTASKEGYTTEWVWLAIYEDTTYDFVLTPLTQYDGSLSGYINDTSMNPIGGARVRVYFHETYEEDYSDSSGYYHVTNIPICYCLKNAICSKAGYKTEWVLLGIVEDTTHDFILTSINHPPGAPTIDGPKNGRIGIEYEYTFNTTDDDGDDVIYFVDWGDDSPIEIVIPTPQNPDNGNEAKASHKWDKRGRYGIRARTEDAFGTLSPWSDPYPVTMPRNRATYNSLFLRLSEQFPILQKLLLRFGLQ